MSAGWHSYPPPNDQLLHYIGSFRPPGGSGSVGPHGELRASFEVVVPNTLETGMKVVVAMFTRPTSGPVPASQGPYAPHVYPGDPAWYDLFASGPGGVHVDVAARYYSMSVPFKLVSVQHVPRTTGRPVFGEMQRLRQTRKAVKHLLTQPPFSIDEDDIAYYVDCGSFGGFTAPLAALYYPKEFHAALGYAFTGALRSLPSEFDSRVAFTALLGTDGSGTGYDMRDALEFPFWCRQEDTDFASASFSNRWARGHVQRPTYFVLGDEDSVSTGTDWLPILKGTTELQSSHDGHMNVTNALGRAVDVLWSVITKTGHSEPRLNVFTVRGGPAPVRTTDISLIFDVMVQKAYDELSRLAVLPIDDPQLGLTLANQATLPSVDHSFPALAHGGSRTYSGGSNPNLMSENTTAFKRYGQGTWLGANESMKVATLALPGHDRASVFVGSADGYVTRLVMAARPVANPTIQPLVEVERTSKNSQPYALGYGAWGLAVGNVIVSAPERPELVVLSYDKVAIFDAETLTWIREATLPNWEYTNPAKLQLGDLLDGAEEEIVFRTLHGHLVIMDQNLTIRYEHQEGGIIDMVIGPTPAPRSGTWLKRPIYLLSSRGHVVRLEMDHTIDNLNAGILAGASPLQYGGLRDLDIMRWGGQDRIAALCIVHPAELHAVRFFAPDDCSLIGGFGNVVVPTPPPGEAETVPISLLQARPSGDHEPSLTHVDSPSGDRYLISCAGEVSVWDGQYLLGNKLWGSFRPALGVAAVQAGDIDPSRPGDEVVVATVGGRVVWFTLDDLTTPGTTITGSDFLRSSARFVYDPSDQRVHEHRCNLSLAATWGMASEPASGSTPGKLAVIDPAGVWWEVDPQGRPTWVRDLQVSSWNLRSANATTLQLGTGGNAHREWETQADSSAPPRMFVRSRPYVPKGSVHGEWWLPGMVTIPPIGPIDARAYTEFWPGHWVLPLGGATYFDASTSQHWCAWWASYSNYTNLVQRVTYTVSNGVASMQDIWGSTQGMVGNGAPPPRWPPSATGFLNSLCAEYSPAAFMRMRAIGIGKVLQGRTVPQVVVANSGAQILLLDGEDGTVISEMELGLPKEAPDFGQGGMALAVADLTGDGFDDVVFAPMYNPIPHAGQTVRSHIHVLESNAAGDGLDPIPVSTVPVAGSGVADDFIGYGACGLAILDLPTNPITQKAIVVTTTNGELTVFTHSNGIINQTPLFRAIVEGSIGAFGSIVLANLDPADSKPELYLAGSSGIRRFDFSSPP